MPIGFSINAETMKLSSRGRYGVRAMFDIAFHQGDVPAQIKDIADRQAIPPRFLEQIFQDLRRAGLITSKRGPRGGYQLARAPSEVRLGDVVRALDGPIADFGTDPTPMRSRSAAARDARKITDELFQRLTREVEACFDGVSIADMVLMAEQQGASRVLVRPYVYAI